MASDHLPNLYEMIGRKQVEIERLGVEYGNLLELMRRIKRGDVAPLDVAIDGNSWRICGSSPETPTPESVG